MCDESQTDDLGPDYSKPMRRGILGKLRAVDKDNNKPLSRALKLATKMLKDSVTSNDPASRTGSHPVVKVKIAAELKRPRTGLIETLMEEGREAFWNEQYEVSVVKFLAVEALLAKYGEILASNKAELEQELGFLKIQFFLMSGLTAEAWAAFKSRSYRGSSYLWHRRYSARYRLNSKYWDRLCASLNAEFTANRNGKLFALLGYALVMSRAPYRANNLSIAFGYKPDPGDELFKPFLLRHENLVASTSTGMAEWLPKYLAESQVVTPLTRKQDTLYLGSPRDLPTKIRQELAVKTGCEIVQIPVTRQIVQVRNAKIYI